MSALAAMPRPKYQVMPALTPDEEEWLRNDIVLHGVLVPVEVDENGDILDGHHRERIARELGRDYPVVIREGLTEDQKLEHVVSLNVVRRQMSGHDRQAVIADLKRRGLSLRAIAKAVGVHHTTVMRSLAGADAPADVDQPSGPTSDAGEAMEPTDAMRAASDEEARDAATPEPIPQEPEPIEVAPSLRDRVLALRAEGMSQRAIADLVGVSPTTVWNLVNAKGQTRTRIDTSAEWPGTKSLISELRKFASADPRRIAASVPGRNRASTARQLRTVGTFLGSIALELERSER